MSWIVSVAFISVNGSNVESAGPKDDESPVNLSLKKGIKLLHPCCAVPNIDEAFAVCKKRKFHCISRPAPAVAFDNKPIIRVYSRIYGLFELLEDPAND